MDEQVGALAAVAGVMATPLVLAAVRWAPGVGRPATVPAPAASWRAYALVGGLCAVVLGVIGARVGTDPALGAYVVFGLVAVALVLVDVQHHRLPDVLTLTSYPIGAGLLGFAALAGSDTGRLRGALLGAAVGFGAYALLYVAVRSGIGAGDVKYAGVVGMHAGWFGWGSLLVALVGGFVVGGAVSLLLLARGRAGLRTKLPFGPAMVAGALIAIGWGEPLAAAWITG